MMLHHIQIKGDEARVHIDEKEIVGVREIEYHASANEIPIIDISVVPQACDMEVIAETGLTVNIDDVEDALKCIQLEMRLDSEFRKAMIASASSVLVERGEDLGTARLIGEQILGRIFDV